MERLPAQKSRIPDYPVRLKRFTTTVVCSASMCLISCFAGVDSSPKYSERTNFGIGQNVGERCGGVSPQPAPATGVLVIGARHSAVEIFLDGRSIGITPIFRVEVRPGVHILVVKDLNGNVLERRRVTIRAGQTLRLILEY